MIDLSLMRGVHVDAAARSAPVEGGAHLERIQSRDAAVSDSRPPAVSSDRRASPA